MPFVIEQTGPIPTSGAPQWAELVPTLLGMITMAVTQPAGWCSGKQMA